MSTDEQKEKWRMHYEKNKESHAKAQAKYNKENTKQFAFRFNKKTDRDIIAYLESLDQKNAYIRQLIRADMQQNGYDMIYGKPPTRD